VKRFLVAYGPGLPRTPSAVSRVSLTWQGGLMTVAMFMYPISARHKAAATGPSGSSRLRRVLNRCTDCRKGEA